MRRLVAGFGCAWVLWSAAADGPPSAPPSTWTVVATVGGSEACTAAAASLKSKATATPPQYVCLPEGQRPPRR
jgi:hypothetical protein